MIELDQQDEQLEVLFDCQGLGGLGFWAYLAGGLVALVLSYRDLGGNIELNQELIKRYAQAVSGHTTPAKQPTP